MARVQKERELLGTLVSIVAEEDAANYVERAFEECARIEKMYSRFLDGNELDYLNRNVGEWVKVDEEFYELLKFGGEMKWKTGGAFDMTVKSYLDAWGYDKNYSFKEAAGEAAGGGRAPIPIQEPPLRCGSFRNDGWVKVDAEVDFGAFGKGYALDRMARCLEEAGEFCVNAGGDIYAKGRDWKVLFEHPFDAGKAIGAVYVNGMALASSGAEKRKWGDKHHLVDPRSGRPADDMLSVYTQAETGILADAYATALFVLGYESAKKMVVDFPVEAMLIGANGAIWKTEGFQGELYG